jgi:glycosyltransferase involved in cell wall biosynthesis
MLRQAKKAVVKNKIASGVPKILMIGGPDVDSRIPFIHQLGRQFDVFVLGSNRQLAPSFKKADIGYSTYDMNRGTNPLADILMLRRLTRIISSHRVDIVHTFDTKPCVWGRLAAWRSHTPIIIGTLPGLGVLYSQGGLRTRVLRSIYQPLQKLACTLSDMTIFQNSHDAEQFIQDGVVDREKTTILPGSGLDTQFFSLQRFSPEHKREIRASLNLDENQVVITMVSRLIRSKGVLEFASAAQFIRKQYHQAVFLLIGADDHESQDVLTPREREGLTTAVNYLGKRNDIPELLAISDIFVLPTYYREGIPRVLLEAASMELPIVATTSPGCTEITKEGINGFLVPVRDHDALGRAIATLIADPSLRKRFGQESRFLAVSQFEVSTVAEQTALLYKHFLTNRKNGNKTHLGSI